MEEPTKARCKRRNDFNVPVIDAIENGSIDLALRYEISVGFTPRLERSLGIGAEELEQQRVVGFDPCLRKAMTAMVELDETRMCNLLGN